MDYGLNEMKKDKNKWYENRVLRSVDNLKLWQNNPRFDPSNKLITVRDYVEELISDKNDEQSFLDLLSSISDRGFLSFDPIVVWQDENNNFLVAEGNRRVMALKLLRSPEKAPIAIRKTVIKLSRKIDRDSIEKIRVCVAPSYNDAQWYILQRHSNASHQIRWQRLQQQRFIIRLYDTLDQNIEETIRQSGFKRAAIIEALRYVKIRDIATKPEVTVYLTEEEKTLILSHRLSMTILERWFGNSQVREAWHINFSEDGVSINAEPQSFYLAYAEFLKLMLNKNNKLGYAVNTRSIDSHFQEIFDSLPKVFSLHDKTAPKIIASPKPTADNMPEGENEKRDPKGNEDGKPFLKGNPKRRQLTDKYHDIHVKNYKLKALFEELQKLPVYLYPNVSAAAIRIFLELAVDEYVISNELQHDLAKREKSYNDVKLLQKLSILRGEFINDRDANKVIDQLLHHGNDYSLNTLNEYIHGVKIHKVEPQFLNRFWDMLSPLFSILINLRDI